MEIKSEAFFGCSSLEQLTNFDRITEIEDAAFAECSSLTSVLKFNEQIYSVPCRLFYGCSSMVGPLTITSSISRIESYAFYNCSELTIETNFDLSNFEYIHDYSFYNCKNINGELILSEEIKEIGNYAFYNCSKLTGDLIINISDYYYEENMVKIGEYAFYGCTGFTGNFIINSCIGSIGKESFGLTNFDQIIYNYSYAPPCSESIGENIDIYVLVNYKPDSFCKNKFIRDLPYIGIYDVEDFIYIDTYGLYDYKDFYINYFDELFASQNNENETYINYLEYDTNYERTIPFKNEMKPNQYLTLFYQYGMRIEYYSGQLNLFYPFSYIVITDTYDFNISIMGSGFLIFEIYNSEPDESTKYHINIFSNSTFVDTFQFKLQDTNNKIESISIEDVTLVMAGCILPVVYEELDRENIVAPKLEIKKLTVEPYTNATIEAAKITGPFIIKHNTKIKLLDVDLTEAEMIYEMGPHINKNNVFTDPINSKPKSFTILEPENPKRNFKKEYILIDANFDCLNWNISIGQNSKYLEKYECVEVRNSRILADSNDLKHYQLKLITKDDVPPIIDNDDENNSNNDQGKKDKGSDKLSTGVIIGIVVGCVVVVTALMIAEYFIITRCIRNNDVSKNEGNEEI